MTTKRLRRVRQRLPCRRAARALGEISGARISHARQARAVAQEGAHRLLPQGQRRDVPRHDEPQPAAPCAVAAGHDLGGDRRARPDVTASGDRGRLGPAGASCRYGRDGGRPGLLYPTWFAEGFFLVQRPGRRLRAGARLQQLDRRLLQGGAGPALRRRDDAAAEHGLRARGVATGGADAVHSAPCSSGRCSSRTATSTIRITTRCGRSWSGSGITAAVHPTPGLWNPEWTSHGQFIEKVKDRLAQPPVPGGRRRPVCRRQRRRRSDDHFHCCDAARSSDGADPGQLAGQPHVRRLDPDRLYGDAALSRR